MADLINRDHAAQAIEAYLCNQCDHDTDCDPECIACPHLDGAKILKSVPVVNRWIPCSERMPEVGIPVLIYDKHHKAFFVAKLDEDYFGFSSNMWHHSADVPFWMPLPEPPKEDENG